MAKPKDETVTITVEKGGRRWSWTGGGGKPKADVAALREILATLGRTQKILGRSGGLKK